MHHAGQKDHMETGDREYVGGAGFCEGFSGIIIYRRALAGDERLYDCARTFGTVQHGSNALFIHPQKFAFRGPTLDFFEAA